MNRLILLGLSLVFIGLLLIFVSLLSGAEKTNVEYGGFVLIGPFPLVFGNSKDAILISLVLGIIAIILFFLFLNQIRI